ncbi:hypothetical protein PV08_06736 [Exophiala spinifera]|uniref:F-box domain-containing protein n=1 Tax=Exophiala spinifera TaxID=91928 RepID=A0A0D2B5J5_9EURO|nr:uncharacterized protein PV08_06736 [Exophiala spinifera]KIW13955.1 hypothetical protein PV08_06736 [Exophiala spinifera]
MEGAPSLRQQAKTIPSSHNATTLLNLPTELLNHIVFFLDNGDPLTASILRKPKAPQNTLGTSHLKANHSYFDDSNYRDCPLKILTVTSRLLRKLVLPFLFQHARPSPECFGQFLAFLASNHLASKVTSIHVYLTTHCNHVQPPWWGRILNALPSATKITVTAPPEVLNGLAGIYSWSNDAWAFDMPLQVLQLRRPLKFYHDQIDYETSPNFLSSEGWTGMTVNEGSSLLAYTTYEFFSRRTPSLLTALRHNDSMASGTLFANLTHFDFIAIFPFYNHVDEVLHCIRKMKRLQRLFLKLCPDPDTTIFRDEVESAGGHMDINDPWNECETSWVLLAHTVLYLTLEGDLCELEVADVQIEALRHTLEDKMSTQLHEWWCYSGHASGLWRRRNERLVIGPETPSTVT